MVSLALLRTFKFYVFLSCCQPYNRIRLCNREGFAADLKKRGFKFLGSTLLYSYLQAVGLINDHATTCPMFKEIGGKIFT